MLADSGLRQIRIVEPSDFCAKYARLQPGEWGWKGNWKRLLAHTLGYSEKTVEAWGNAPEYPKCPDHAKKHLEQIDALITAESVIKRHGLNREYLKNLD